MHRFMMVAAAIAAIAFSMANAGTTQARLFGGSNGGYGSSGGGGSHGGSYGGLFSRHHGGGNCGCYADGGSAGGNGSHGSHGSSGGYGGSNPTYRHDSADNYQAPDVAGAPNAPSNAPEMQNGKE